MLYQTIKADRMSAMKNRDKVAKSILTTLLGELEGNAKRNGLDVSDDDVLKLIKKFIDANKESLQYKPDPNLEIENSVLTSYLPKQLSESELRDIITSLGDLHIGQVMKHLSQNYNGQYDGNIASKIIKAG
jgi:uncharacterized protein YqeY